jgi:RHS repeat-associated protein
MACLLRTGLWGNPGDGSWSDCGPNDRLTVTLTSPPGSAPQGQTWKQYYYAGGQRVAERVLTQSTNTLYYLHGDHLGSTSKVTCGNSACATGGITVGAVVASQYYYPFGGVRHISGTLPTDFGFTGQRRDGPGVDLMFYKARFYDGHTGRFASADSIVPGAGNPQALNRYSYVLNAPTRYTDPTGHFACSGTFNTGLIFQYDCNTWIGKVLSDIESSGDTGKDLAKFMRDLDSRLDGKFMVFFHPGGDGVAPPLMNIIFIPEKMYLETPGTWDWYDNLGTIAHEMAHHKTSGTMDRVTTRSEAAAYQIEGRIRHDLHAQGKGPAPSGFAGSALGVDLGNFQQLAQFKEQISVGTKAGSTARFIYTNEPTWGVRVDFGWRYDAFLRANPRYGPIQWQPPLAELR